jgi:hypothetical protein
VLDKVSKAPQAQKQIALALQHLLAFLQRQLESGLPPSLLASWVSGFALGKTTVSFLLAWPVISPRKCLTRTPSMIQFHSLPRKDKPHSLFPSPSEKFLSQ